MQVNFIGLLNLLIAFINISLGILVLLKSKRLLINIIYALSVFTIAIWAISLYFYINPVIWDSIVWLKIVYLSAYGMTLTQVLFTYFFPKRVSVKFWPYYFSIICLVLLGSYWLINDQIILGIISYPQTNNVEAILSDKYIFYSISVIYSVIFILAYYFKKIKYLNTREKEQMLYYLTGAVLMIIPVVVFDFLFPLLLKNTLYFQYSAISNLFFASIVAYSMLKKRFLGVRTITGKMFLYFCVTVYNSFFVFLLLYLLVKFYLGVDLSVNLDLLLIIFIFCLLLSVGSIEIFKFVENYLKRKYIYKNDPEYLIRYFTKITSEEFDIKSIIKNASVVIDEMINVKDIGISIYDTSKSISILEKKPVLEKDLELIKFFARSQNEIFVKDELVQYLESSLMTSKNKLKRLISFMEKNELTIILPRISEDGILTIIYIGYRLNDETYKQEEVEWLISITDNIIVSISRALLYQEVQQLNENLRNKVEEQTKEIRLKMEHMQQMRDRERDMLDIMGHELRTPLTIIKNATELLEISKKSSIEREGKPVWDDMVEKQFTHIRGAMRRELGLVETLLSATKLDANRLQVNMTKVDLTKVVENTELAFRKEAESKGLKFEVLHDRRRKCEVQADALHLQQVVDNLVSNAVKYTMTGTVSLRIMEEEEEVMFEVRDSGEGISKEALKNLGKKFYRANQYINDKNSGLRTSVVRPGGTGLGLYVTFGLVKAMGGRYEVESEVGKGSVFRVYLLKNKN